MSPEFHAVPVGENRVKIRGIALKSNMISRNGRKYIDEELTKAARTWIGKPITINHSMDKKVGTVEWMEHDADGNLEYVAVVNKQPYVDMIHVYGHNPKESSIVGVSIEANFLHNVCPECKKRGVEKRFYSEEEFHKHMHGEHFIKTNPTSEPHGIVGQALSLVISPEVPGVSGTTIELMETEQHGLSRLLETVITVKEEEEEMKQVLPYSTKETQTPKTETPKAPEPKQEDAPKPPEQPIQATALQVMEHSGKKARIQKLRLDEEAPKLTLGEPFAGYTDFADCVAKNQDKDNPEAHCGQIKHQTEGEIFVHAKTAEAVNMLVEALNLLNAELENVKRDFKEAIDKLPKDDTSWNAKIDETVKRIPDLTPLEKNLAETSNRIPDVAPISKRLDELFKAIPNIAPLENAIAELGKRIPNIAPLEKLVAELADPKNLEAFKKTVNETVLSLEKKIQDLLDIADKNIVETRTSLEERIQNLTTKNQQLEKKVAEADAKKLQETEKVVTRLDNLEDKAGKGAFKGKSKMEQADNGEHEGLPYKP